MLHSEHHARATAQGGNLLGSIDVTPVQGAVFSLLECHYGVDVLDEWAFLPRLARFPVVVVPEQTFLSQKMVDALKTYVRSGGKLLVSGAEAFERFGSELIRRQRRAGGEECCLPCAGCRRYGSHSE